MKTATVEWAEGVGPQIKKDRPQAVQVADKVNVSSFLIFQGISTFHKVSRSRAADSQPAAF